MSRPLAFFLCGVLGLLALPLGADVLVFTNGDRLTGTIVKIDLKDIYFHNNTLGNLTVPIAQAHVVLAPALASNSTGNSTAGVSGNVVTDKIAADKVTADKTPVHGKSPMAWILPKDWAASIEFGYNRTRATTVNSQVNLVGELGYKHGDNSYNTKLYYYFDATNNTNGTTTRATDKYGMNLTYRHDFSPRWFFSNEATAERDFVANIRLLAQDAPGLGYYAIKNPKTQLSFIFGPTGRYTDAPGQSDKWLVLLTPREDLKWQLLDNLRLEQDAVYYQDPTDGSNSAWKVDLALIQNLNSWLDVALRFRHSYNPIVGFGGEKTEQYISVTMGIVF
jgi:putative salt-induced outer membrane protein YdiY